MVPGKIDFGITALTVVVHLFDSTSLYFPLLAFPISPLHVTCAGLGMGLGWETASSINANVK